MKTERKIIRLIALFLMLAPATSWAQTYPVTGDADLMVFKFPELVSANAETDLPYLEFMRVESMNAYIYELSAGEIDEQEPHPEDEIYYVVEGRSNFTAGEETVAVEPGDILYVRKNVTHVFSNITEDLKLLVVFAPPDIDE
ncbi:MAG: cupin domain-containing protein [Woeseiaceae bacterium]